MSDVPNSISSPTLLGWSVREPDKALVVQNSYAVVIGGITSTAVQTIIFLPGANLDSLPASVTDVIGHVWTPDVLAAQQSQAQAAEAARIAAFNTAIDGLTQAKAVAVANSQPAAADLLQHQIDMYVAARDAGAPFDV